MCILANAEKHTSNSVLSAIHNPHQVTLTGTWHILRNGIQFLEPEIEILPYLKMRKVEKLSVFELAGLGAKGFTQWALIEPFSYRKNLFEIISSENDAKVGYDVLNRAWLLNTLLVLRRHTRINSIALLNRSWTNIKDIDKDFAVEANLCDYHVKMLTLNGFDKPAVDEDDINWISKHFELANILANKNEKFKYALTVTNTWRYCVDLRSAIAIIWAAIESIVDVSTEITYRLSLSLSSLLRDRGDLRLQKFNEIKTLYKLRSKVIHGSEIKTADATAALSGSVNLLSELICYMIENDRLVTEDDFKSAIFH